jgi:hypothetical protein
MLVLPSYKIYCIQVVNFISRCDIFKIENHSVYQIPMFSQIFPMRNMGILYYVRNVCKKKFIAVLIFLRHDQHCFSYVSSSIYPRYLISKPYREHFIDHWIQCFYLWRNVSCQRHHLCYGSESSKYCLTPSTADFPSQGGGALYHF